MITGFKENILSALPQASERQVSILLGVSGGMDSICMAELFLRLNLDLRLAVAHANFSLRGEESDSDELFVRSWCQSKGVQCFVRKFDTAEFASSRGVSIEMAARELRYRWFESLMAEEHFEYVAVAHNLNDNVETMFLNIVRGTGLTGLTGMKILSGKLLRPLLTFTREEIESYFLKNNLSCHQDRTNSDVKYHRNRIRNNIFPQLSQINPSFLKTIGRDMNFFGDADAIIEEILPEKIEHLSTLENGILCLSIDGLKKEKYRAFWLHKLLEPYGFNSSQIVQISQSIDTQSGKQFLSDKYKLIRDRQFLKLYPLIDNFNYGCRFTIKERGENFAPKEAPEGILYVDADKVCSFSGIGSTDALIENLSSRPWHQSDRFRPLGMRGEKLVSDFFNDIKLDIEQKKRERIIVVNSPKKGETIVAIASRRIDDRFKVTDSTVRLLEIALEQCNQVSQ